MAACRLNHCVAVGKAESRVGVICVLLIAAMLAGGALGVCIGTAPVIKPFTEQWVLTHSEWP